MFGTRPEPLTVTCLCLTRNRRRFLPRAICSFMEQAYEHRALLILADGEDISDLVPDDPRIKLKLLPEHLRPKTIGEKRNLGCSMVDTDLICHWDDDDWSAPGRISDQVHRITESMMAVTGYRSLDFECEDGGWFRYTADPGVQWAFGTSLMYRRDWWNSHRFNRDQVGEDNAFVNQAVAMRQFIATDANNLMVGAVHSGNTSKKVLEGRPWKRIEPLSPQGFCRV